MYNMSKISVHYVLWSDEIMNDFELKITPVADYKTPIMPKYGEDKPAMLKKLPSRWQKGAKFVAGLSLAGLLALSGCGRDDYTEPQQRTIDHGLRYVLNYSQGTFDRYGNYGGYNESELALRLHGGGGGSSWYVVQLTEQEAFGMIRARLEAAGLNFDFDVPDYTADSSAGDGYIEIGLPDMPYRLDLFDKYKGVGIVFVDTWGWGWSNRDIANLVAETFEESEHNITVGAFYNPIHSPLRRGDIIARGAQTPSQAMVEAQRHVVVSQIVTQADIFIARLQSEGILEPFSDVSIIINGIPFDYGNIPILVDNHKMVPAVPLFEMLGMTVSHEIDGRRVYITATKGNNEISINRSGNSVRSWMINGEQVDNDGWVHFNSTVFIMNDTVLVPLRYFAESVSANVEWDEETRTFTITTS